MPAFERGRNLEGQHNSKCDVKGHLKVKFPSTFRRLGVPTRQPLFFQTLTDSLTEEAKRISFSFNHLCTLSLATEGIPPVFPIWELIPLSIPAHYAPYFQSLMKCRFRKSFIFRFIHVMGGGVPVGVPPTFQRADVPTSDAILSPYTTTSLPH